MYDHSENKTNSRTITISLLVIFFLISSLPLFIFGFSGDDLYISQVKGLLMTEHQTLISFIKEIVLKWISTGRLFFVPFITNFPLFYLIGNNVILYNLIHWLATLISLGFACLFLYKLTNKKELIVLFAGLFPFCWFLAPNTPWVAQALLLPLSTSFSMLALINYINFIQRNKINYLLYMGLFFSLSLLTYEVALILPPLALVLHWWAKGYSNKRKFIATGILFFITIVYLNATIFLRHVYEVSYEGISIGTISDLPSTFVKQFVGEFPLMNLYLLRDHLYFPIEKRIYYTALLLGACAIAFFYRQLNNTTPIKGSRYVLIISLLLQLLPAALVGMSRRYQLVLTLGMSHLPVLIQQIGLCMMLALICNNSLSYLTNRFNKKQSYLKLIIAIGISSIISISFIGNQLIATWYNQFFRYPREIFEKSLQRGLFNPLPLNANIITNFLGMESFWNTTQLRAQLINRSDILLFDLNGKAPFNDEKYEKDFAKKFADPIKNNFYYLDYAHLINSPKSGYSLIARINKHTGPQSQLTLELDNIKIFYYAKSTQDFKQILSTISEKYKSIHFKDFAEKPSGKLANKSGYITIPSTISYRVC